MAIMKETHFHFLSSLGDFTRQTFHRNSKTISKKNSELTTIVKDLYTHISEKTHAAPLRTALSIHSYGKELAEMTYKYSPKGIAYSKQLAQLVMLYTKKIFEAPAVLGRSFFSLWEFTHRRFSFGFSPKDKIMDLYNAGSGGGPTLTTIHNMELAVLKAMELNESKYKTDSDYYSY